MIGEKKVSTFKKILIGEGIFCLVALFVMGGVVFPLIADIRMLHIKIALHTVIISVSVSVFTLFGIALRGKWATHKKYMLIPLIFTLFAIILNVIADSTALI